MDSHLYSLPFVMGWSVSPQPGSKNGIIRGGTKGTLLIVDYDASESSVKNTSLLYEVSLIQLSYENAEKLTDRSWNHTVVD